MFDKRGILLKEVVYLVLAILVIAIIFPALLNVYNTVLTDKEQAQAKGTLERLEFALQDATAEEASSFLGYVPQNWWLVAFDKDAPIPECLSQSCVCVCDEEDCSEEKYCKPIDKDLKDINSGELIKTRFISSLIITSGDIFNVLVRYYPEDYGPFVPSSGTSVDNYFSEKYPALNGVGQAVLDTAIRTKIPTIFIIAVAVHESDGGKSKLSGETCLGGPSKFSNNLFGLTGETGTAGSCKWETKECFTKEESEKTSFEVLGTDNCNIGCGEKTCYRVKRPFRAYHDKGESIIDFGDWLTKNPRYKDSIENYNSDLLQLAKDIGVEKTVNGKKKGGYATDPNWSNKVSALALEIRKEIV